MSTGNANSRPKPAAAPVISVSPDAGGYNDRRNMWRLLPAALMSVVVHLVLFGAFVGFIIVFGGNANAGPNLEEAKEESVINAEQVVEEKKDPLLATDIDPAATEFDTDINYNVDRKADVSVPGAVNPNEAVGILDGDKAAPPMNLAAPGGFGAKGTGGALEVLSGGNSNAIGDVGGYGPRGVPLAGSFFGRSGATRDAALRDGGGTKASEAAVAKGLKWLIRMQSPDGKWMLDHPAFKDKGQNNDTAGTAFGLLPLLAAGKTHKPAPDNPYDKSIEKALAFLIRRQNKDPKSKNFGDFGGGMYGHGLAAIAMCEAYGLSQDPNLRRPAQLGINFIVSAQHEAGGWRYSPGQAGDTSVSGWQVMALKSALMAGLDVPEVTLRKAQRYLDSVVAPDEGYGYTGPGSTPSMTAVGLLCRQYLQNWGPQNLKMIKGVDAHLKPNPPGAKKDIYYYYYATQVMHHFGGQAWKEWNDKMREFLIKTQDDGSGPNQGSWSSAEHPHAGAGGRLMVTSMNLLTLEVYYRYLPLYYREQGVRKDGAVQKAL